jgi:hypothetical protein
MIELFSTSYIPMLTLDWSDGNTKKPINNLNTLLIGFANYITQFIFCNTISL